MSKNHYLHRTPFFLFWTRILKIEVFETGQKGSHYPPTQTTYIPKPLNYKPTRTMSSNTNKTTGRRSVEEIVAHNSEPRNGVSLCIPRVFNNIGWKRVKRHMIEANLGFVEAVHLIPRGQYKRAYVHFRANSWNMRDPVARQALTALQNGQKIRIEYDEPWYWEVSISRSERRAEAPKPKERKVQIRLTSPAPPTASEAQGPNLNDPIVARAMENASTAASDINYDRSLQCDDEMRGAAYVAAAPAIHPLDRENGRMGDVPPPPNPEDGEIVAGLHVPQLVRQFNIAD